MDTHGKLTARFGAERFSGVELLKILAIFMIITSHVAQTISSENSYTVLNFDVLDLGAASNSAQLLIMSLMRTLGGGVIVYSLSALLGFFLTANG
ncbi:MAG: hypothetical protein LUG92_00635 [Oscillospiraceae bacterium]|nr:hypothetical protein [Oscillospiraceae bacterium]